MIDFARTVFGDEFDPAGVVGEERLTLDEWAAGAAEAVAELGLAPRTPTRADLAAVNATLDRVHSGDARALTLEVLAALYVQVADGSTEDASAAV